MNAQIPPEPPGGTASSHLWEIHHPYYCAEGNYYKPLSECHDEYDSWAQFYDERGTMDDDLNLVFRWDWKRCDPPRSSRGRRARP